MARGLIIRDNGKRFGRSYTAVNKKYNTKKVIELRDSVSFSSERKAKEQFVSIASQSAGGGKSTIDF